MEGEQYTTICLLGSFSLQNSWSYSDAQCTSVTQDLQAQSSYERLEIYNHNKRPELTNLNTSRCERLHFSCIIRARDASNSIFRIMEKSPE